MSVATLEKKPEFRPWGKIGRLNRDVILTEKIDGTNAAINISYDYLPETVANVYSGARHEGGVVTYDQAGHPVWVGCQSRKRMITPESDNFNFAQWVYDNALDLVADLGAGLHFGEWWGSGIQRGYGLEKGLKKFSLFNVRKWSIQDFRTENLHTVPVIDMIPFDTGGINAHVRQLEICGSLAAPGFKPPEGIVVFHTHTQDLFKVTCTDDEKHKYEV